MGENRSDADLTLSTTPNSWAAATRAPTWGSSTYTTSPSSCWAKSVIPTVTSSPSRRAHSCSVVYLNSSGTGLPSLTLPSSSWTAWSGADSMCDPPAHSIRRAAGPGSVRHEWESHDTRDRFRTADLDVQL